MYLCAEEAPIPTALAIAQTTYLMYTHEEHFAYVLQHGLFSNADHRERLSQTCAQLHDISAGNPALFKAACDACKRSRYLLHCDV